MTSPPGWQPGTQYNYGDIVEFECVRYKIIQPHISQGDWTPPKTPALWGRIPDNEWDNHAPYDPPHDKGDYHPQDVHPPEDCGHQNPDDPHEEPKKWWDLDDNRKNQLKIGGGLLAGAAIIGGGYMAWHEHEKKKTEEEKQALTWGVQDWHKDSYTRTEEFRNHGPRGTGTTWVLVDGRDKIPNSALEAGRDRDNNPIYIARAYYENGIQIGKASPVFKEGAVIGYGGRVVELNKFEVLIGDPRAVRWVRYSYQLNIQELGATPVEGGREANSNQKLYVARVRYNDGVHTAKCGEHLLGANLAFSGTEVVIDDYEVLCLN
ncbi:carbohydrate-binding module family 12 protein [Russula aff. rugulosa BPL654]|nr:carbohydrate-binding module family 12 protein [Russula aff. rugulosa BPL654]